MTDLETYLICPKCSYVQWVSSEDEDSSFGELWNHVLWDHANVDQRRTSQLMAKVKKVKR